MTSEDFNRKRFERILQILNKIDDNINERNILEKDTLDVKEACRYLNISDSFIYKLTSTKKLPYSKPNGKKIWFRKSDLDVWKNSRVIQTENDMDKEAKKIAKELLSC